MKNIKKTQIASIGFSEIMETPDERSEDTFDFEQLQFIVALYKTSNFFRAKNFNRIMKITN